MKRLAPPASARRRAVHHSASAFSAPRMRTPLGPSRTSWSLYRTNRLPLTLSLSPAGTPESVSEPPDALFRSPPLAERQHVNETCEPEDPGTTRR